MAFVLLIFAAPAAADVGDNGIGLNTHHPDDSMADMARDLGVNWIRVDGNWHQMQPERDRYDWSLMDAVVQRASDRGMQVYFTLAYTPEWVPRVPERRPDAYIGNDEPVSSDAWVAFVEASVVRYRERGVTHFGIWNEPNLSQFWDGNADAYIDKILIPGAAAVRRVCSDCVVLGPDLAHVGDYDAFLNRVMARASSSFDILAHHLYNGWPEHGVAIWDGDRFLEALEMRRSSFSRESLRGVLDRHGWSGEVWITETGYRASEIGDAADEERQADYARRVMDAQLARDWWTNTFFYEAVDCVPFLPTCTIDGFGITRANHTGERTWPADYRAKPAFTAIQAYIASHAELPADAPPITDPPVTEPPDAGAPSGSDAGLPLGDAGPVSADAGPAGPDAATIADAGARLDAAAAGSPTPTGCSIGRASTPGGTALCLVGGLFLAFSRRRSRARTTRP